MSSTPTPAPVPVVPSPGQQNVTYVVYQMPAPDATAQTVSIDCRSCLTFYAARTFITLLLWASWVVYIAGVSKNQQTCADGGMKVANGVPFADALALSTVNAVPSDASSCVYFYGLTWWSIWLQFTTTIFVTITTFQIFSGVPYVKGMFTTALYFIIMSNVLMFFIAQYYNNALYVNLNKLTNPQTAWTAGCSLVLVGTICCMIFNCIYLIWNSYTNVPTLPAAPAVPVPTVDAHVAPEGAKAESA